MDARIRLLSNPTDDEIAALAIVFRDGIEAGGALNFARVPDLDELDAWWRSYLARDGVSTWVAELPDAGIVGTLSLVESRTDNGRHRADVEKMIVHRDARGRGLARALLAALEAEASRRGRTLLQLDTQDTGTAFGMYEHLGWTHIGTIPGFAVSLDGSLHGAAFFYKQLDEPVL